VISNLVRYQQDSATATVTLNRPDRLNAMTGSLLKAVLSAIQGRRADRRVRLDSGSPPKAEPQRRRAIVPRGDLEAEAAQHTFSCATEDGAEGAECQRQVKFSPAVDRTPRSV
jgi:hypothetical protein